MHQVTFARGRLPLIAMLGLLLLFLQPASAWAKSTNSRPTISGTPATSVVAGSRYAFQPTATDPEGQALQFSITNKPTWATFNPATGQLTGTPTGLDVGTHPGISITVSDGKSSASLPAGMPAYRLR